MDAYKPKNMNEAAGGLLDYMDPSRANPTTPADYLSNLQIQSLRNQQAAAQTTAQQLQELQAKPKQTDLTPYAMAVDALTGSNMAQQYQAFKPEDQAQQRLKLSQLYGKQNQGITDDLINMQNQGYKQDQLSMMERLAQAKLAQSEGLGLTPGQEARDKAFGKNIDKEQANMISAAANINRLKTVSDKLRTGDSTYDATYMPRWLRPLTNSKSLDAQEDVEFVAQQSLKQILGGQFSKEEGKQLIERTYNPKLPKEIREARLNKLIGQLDIGLKEKQAAIDHFQREGTLSNFKGGQYSSIAQYEAALKERLNDLTFDEDENQQGQAAQSVEEYDFDNMSIEEIEKIGR